MSNEEREEEEGKVTKKFKDENKMTLITTDTSFPVDDTPTPTKILRMANDLFPDFQDPKENPFDIHFRKAAEAVKSGSDRLSASLAANDIPIAAAEESLNTPSIFPSSALNTPLIGGIKRSLSKLSGSTPGKSLQPLLPNGPIQPPVTGGEGDARVLLQMPSGATFKLYNLPMVKEPVGAAATSSRSRARSKSAEDNQQPQQTSSQLSSEIRSSLESDRGRSDDHKRLEVQERNRYSAKRSRIRKREQLERIEREAKQFSIENNILRDEIIKLKKILQMHLDCDVTHREGQADTIRNMIEPRVLTLQMATAAESSNCSAVTNCTAELVYDDGGVPEVQQRLIKSEQKVVAVHPETVQGGQTPNYQNLAAAVVLPDTVAVHNQHLPHPIQPANHGQTSLTSSNIPVTIQVKAKGEDRQPERLDPLSQHPGGAPTAQYEYTAVTRFVNQDGKLLLPPKLKDQANFVGVPAVARLPRTGSTKTIRPKIDQTLASFTIPSINKSQQIESTCESAVSEEPSHARSLPIPNLTKGAGHTTAGKTKNDREGRKELEVRSPPQTFPEDLRTVKALEPFSDSETEIINRLEEQGAGNCSSRKRIMPNKSLRDKLIELKRKMTEDKRTDDFLNTYRNNEKPL